MSKERSAIFQQMEKYQSMTLKQLSDITCKHKCDNCQWKYDTLEGEKCIALAASVFLNRKYDETINKAIAYDTSHN